MKTVSLLEAASRLQQYVAEAGEGPVIITKDGKPCGALVALEGQDMEAFVLGHSPKFLARLNQAANEAKAHGISLSEVEAEVPDEDTDAK